MTLGKNLSKRVERLETWLEPLAEPFQFVVNFVNAKGEVVRSQTFRMPGCASPTMASRRPWRAKPARGIWRR
jgi:hypothetical protein